jgi:ferredoxin-NADP reductase
MHVNVDGPYGEFVDPANFDTILLIAGGIGVTPIHSIFRELRMQMMKGNCAHLARVHMLWVVQKRDDLTPFFDTLADATNEPLDGKLKVDIYADKDSDIEPGKIFDHHGVKVVGGRPNVGEEINNLSDDVAAGLRPHVFVCGPPGLAAVADLACLKNGISFHKEVFAF